MEKEIIENISALYRSHLVTAIIFLSLGVTAIIVAIGVIKFKILPPIQSRVLLLVLIICVVALLIMQILSIAPVYKDYLESSYVILKDARMTVKTDSSGIIDSTKQLFVIDAEGNHYKLKIQNDSHLTMGDDYTGTVVYLKHSNYVIWYYFD